MKKRFVPEALRVSAPRDGKPCPQASALRFCSPPLRYAFPLRSQGWEIPLGLPLLSPLRDADNKKLLDGIGWQHDRGNLLRFLEREGVEPTNNRAERILRPAVIARKVAHFSKDHRGADAFVSFVSIAQTARKKAQQTTSRVLRDLFTGSPHALAR